MDYERGADSLYITLSPNVGETGIVREFKLPLTLFGGRFGKTGTEAPDEVTNDDGISHMIEGGLHLNLRYEMMPNNSSCKIFAKIE